MSSATVRRGPIRWMGGKGQYVPRILPLFPAHRIYCEPFGGGASLLIAKDPAPVEVYNDLDAGLHTFFSVLADPVLFEAFRRRVAGLPYSRRLYYQCLAEWSHLADPVERAAAWFVVARQSFGGRFGSSWGYAVDATTAGRGMAMTCAGWLAGIERLPEIHARLQRVQIENQAAARVIAAFDTPDTLFYLDPPYVADTRAAGSYAHEMTDADHGALIDQILGLAGMVLISGYDHPIYHALDAAGWDRTEWDAVASMTGRTRAIGKGRGVLKANQARRECLWRNPAAVAAVATRETADLFALAAAGGVGD